jgi:hypothetical protein
MSSAVVVLAGDDAVSDWSSLSCSLSESPSSALNDNFCNGLGFDGENINARTFRSLPGAIEVCSASFCRAGGENIELL